MIDRIKQALYEWGKDNPGMEDFAEEMIQWMNNLFTKDIGVGDTVLLIDGDTGEPYKIGIIDRYDPTRKRVGVITSTKSYAAWSSHDIIKLKR